MTDIPTPLRIHFQLLDRQITDPAGDPVGKVDDVELNQLPDGRVQVSALLVGQEALGRRLGGSLGRWMAGTARRLHPSDTYQPLRIPLDQVAGTDSAVHIRLRRQVLATPPLEQWLDEHLISRIPGAGDAG